MNLYSLPTVLLSAPPFMDLQNTLSITMAVHTHCLQPGLTFYSQGNAQISSRPRNSLVFSLPHDPEATGLIDWWLAS